jgi:hypothetical protein
MDEHLVRKSLKALDGLERQRSEAIEVLVRHLTSDTPSCEETINRLFDVMDVPPAEREVGEADEARQELKEALDGQRQTGRAGQERRLGALH